LEGNQSRFANTHTHTQRSLVKYPNGIYNLIYLAQSNMMNGPEALWSEEYTRVIEVQSITKTVVRFRV